MLNTLSLRRLLAPIGRQTLAPELALGDRLLRVYPGPEGGGAQGLRLWELRGPQVVVREEAFHADQVRAARQFLGHHVGQTVQGGQ